MMDKRVKLSDSLSVSRIVHGHWRLGDWSLNDQQIYSLVEKLIEIGVTTFDHADIYGDYTCEEKFGRVLNLNNSLRDDIQLVTKCGIKLMSANRPPQKVKYYEYSYRHIVESVENSLRNLNTSHIDLLLLHRPSPFFDYDEVAKAFSDLKKESKVLNFGVSNFSQQQFELLNAYVDGSLVTNQIEVSPYCLEHFDNGNMDYLTANKIPPMAWSPIAGGGLIKPQNENQQRIIKVLSEVAQELDVEDNDKVIYSWLLKHPSKIIPIVGSGRFSRIKSAVDALELKMSLEQWFRIYIASAGKELP